MVKRKIMKQCLAGLLSFAMAVTLLPANALGTVQAAEEVELTIPNMDDIRGNITLPDKDASGAAITWTSDNEAVINPNPVGNTPAGVVTRQNEDTKVKLTATIEKAGGNVTKEFDVTVKKKAEVGAMTDYVFAYFTGDGAGQEKIHFAASRNGLDWEELNKGEAILESTLGTKGLRDPYICRSPEGDKFYMIATDLQIAAGSPIPGVGVWTAAQEKGSQAIMVWESTDLVNWSDQHMATISAKIGAGCTWAPEFFYDKQTGEYIVFWASKVAPNYNKQRVYYCKTRDFRTFTEPQLWIEENHSVIDTTVVEENGIYYRFTKNEDDGQKYIYIETSDSLMGTWKRLSSPTLEAYNNSNKTAVEGPCCFKLNEDDVEGADGYKWCLLLDNWTYFAVATTDLSEAVFTKLEKAHLPSKPRHGTIMPITEVEYKALMNKWGTPSMASDALPGVVKTGYTLPAEVDAVLGGERQTVPVTWDKTEDDFKTPGTVKVTGTFNLNGKTATGTKTITVIDISDISDNLIYFIDSGVGSWNNSLPESGYYKLVGAEVDLRNMVPDQLYKEGSWGIVNPTDNSSEGYENAGNRTDAEDSIYTNGWWAKGGKKCEYIIPLENGTYKATGYFAEWWNQTRPVKFYAEYTDASGNKVQSNVGNVTLSGSNSRQTATVTFDITGIADKTEVHFYAEKPSSNGQDPVIAGLAVEKEQTADEKAQLEVKKDEAKASLEQVAVTPSMSLEPEGKEGQINVTYPADLTEKAKELNLEVVTIYTSSDPGVAQVDSTGKVTSAAEGTAEITTTVMVGSKISKSFATTVKVEKVPETIAVKGVTLNPNKKAVTLAVGKTTTFSAVVDPGNATNTSVTWKSSDNKVASVSASDKTGKVTVTAKKTGTTTITVTTKDGGKKASCTVTVINPKLSQTKVTLGVKETLTLKVNGIDKKAKVTWSSSDKKTADVNKTSGKVTAKKANKKAVKITAKVDGVSLTCNVTVKAAPKGITLNKKATTLGKGKTFQVKVKKYSPANAASNKLTYKSSNKKVATVDSKGKIKAVKKGKATITVTTFNKKKATIKITVK